MSTFWDHLSESLHWAAPDATQVRRPTTGIVRHFAELRGIALPKGYIEFILKFGPGTLFMTRIFGPGYNQITRGIWDLWQRHSEWSGLVRTRGWVPQEMAANLLWFGANDKTWYCWKLDASRPESRVWELGEDRTFACIADTFQGFVQILWERAKADELLPSYDPDLCGPTQEFQPASIMLSSGYYS